MIKIKASFPSITKPIIDLLKENKKVKIGNILLVDFIQHTKTVKFY